MRSSLKRLWTLLFVALVQLPIAAVVSGLVGAQNGLPFWFMGIAAHLQVRSATDLSLRSRLTIWLAAVTVGGITGGFISFAIGLLTLALPTLAVSLSMQALFTLFTADSALSTPNWTGVFIAAALAAFNFAPVMVAWVVSRALVRLSSTRSQVALLPAQNEATTHLNRRRIAALLAVTAVSAASGLGWFLVGHYWQEPYVATGEPQDSGWDESATTNPYDEILRSMLDRTRIAPVAVLSIDALLAEYRENEFAAAAKYENVGRGCLVPFSSDPLDSVPLDKCRFVEASGTIRDMGRDDKGIPYIRLGTADEFVSVEARFPDESEQRSLQPLRREQRVSLRCVVLYKAGRLSLTRCGVV